MSIYINCSIKCYNRFSLKLFHQYFRVQWFCITFQKNLLLCDMTSYGRGEVHEIFWKYVKCAESDRIQESLRNKIFWCSQLDWGEIDSTRLSLEFSSMSLKFLYEFRMMKRTFKTLIIIILRKCKYRVQPKMSPTITPYFVLFYCTFVKKTFFFTFLLYFLQDLLR